MKHLDLMGLYKLIIKMLDKANSDQGGCNYRNPHNGCPLSYGAIYTIVKFLKGEMADQKKLLSPARRKSVCEYYGIEIVNVRFSVRVSKPQSQC